MTNFSEVNARRMRLALEAIRDREWVENTIDPHWAAQVAAKILSRCDGELLSGISVCPVDKQPCSCSSREWQDCIDVVGHGKEVRS